MLIHILILYSNVTENENALAEGPFCFYFDRWIFFSVTFRCGRIDRRFSEELLLSSRTIRRNAHHNERKKLFQEAGKRKLLEDRQTLDEPNVMRKNKAVKRF